MPDEPMNAASSWDLLWLHPDDPLIQTLAAASRRLDPDEGCVVQNAAGAIVAANPAASALLGLPWEQLVGRTSMDPRWSAVMESGFPLTGQEHPAMRTLADGESINDELMGVQLPPPSDLDEASPQDIRWLRVSTQALRTGADGDEGARPESILGVVAFFSDVSGSRRAADASSALVGSRRLIGESTPTAVFRTNHIGTILHVSSPQSSAENLLGQGFLALVDSADAVRIGNLWQQMLTAANPFRAECRCQQPDGSSRWTDLAATPAAGDRGRVEGATVVLRNAEEVIEARRNIAADNGKADDKNSRLRLALQGARLGTWEWDVLTGATTSHDRWAEFVGYRLEELPSTDLETWRSLCHPTDLARSDELILNVLEGRAAEYDCVLRMRHRDGHWARVRAHGVVSERDADGAPLRMSGTHEDVTREGELEAEVRRNERRYRLLAENMTDAVWQVDAEGRVLWASDSTLYLLGWRPDQIVGREVIGLTHADDRALAASGLAELAAGATRHDERRVLCADGSFLTVSLLAHPAHDLENPGSYIATMRNVQPEVDEPVRLQVSPERDRITGLLTRDVVMNQLQTVLESIPVGSASAVTVLCIGVDSLTRVNDALTPAAGDLLIAEIGARIATQAGPRDQLARGLGDTYLLILGQARPARHAANLASSIRRAVSEPFEVEGLWLVPTVSIGIASGGAEAHSEEVVRDAHSAMREAKTAGRNRHHFGDGQTAARAELDLRMMDDIREGFRRDQFVAWFQPIVDLGSDSPVAYEALVRWVLPDGTVVAPDNFLPLAESTGQIKEIDRVVLGQAAALLKRLPNVPHVAVNISARTLADRDHAAHILEVFDDHGLAPSRLHLEVTETTLLTVTDLVHEQMDLLSRAGVKWFADDFGTGFSSISHLRDLPIAGLKLDRSFTHAIGRGENKARHLAKAVLGLADGLKLESVAEGIETPEEAAILRDQGWREGQGWLYGRPRDSRFLS
ncbi:MAG: EAL domain-containing protein [Candidatus Nanopelagicales bacterium]